MKHTTTWAAYPAPALRTRRTRTARRAPSVWGGTKKICLVKNHHHNNNHNNAIYLKWTCVKRVNSNTKVTFAREKDASPVRPSLSPLGAPLPHIPVVCSIRSFSSLADTCVWTWPRKGIKSRGRIREKRRDSEMMHARRWQVRQCFK